MKAKHRSAAVLAAFLLLAIAAKCVEAACPTVDEVHNKLTHTHGEKPLVTAPVNGGRGVLRIYVNSSKLTWTAVMIRPDGKACVIWAGGNFRYEIIGEDT